ncbi:hypothetical protein [Streptomyces cinereoruber]|uniref:hypothetical protein n=1 Tax=Streptomyces cinereoruber TaxID=67260 RepID=UPI00363D0E4B
MGITFFLEAESPPLDSTALRRELASLPCVVPYENDPDIWWLAGDRDSEADVRDGASHINAPMFGITDSGIWLAIEWHDNRYDHGAHLLYWLLQRHACRGQESDYGSRLSDNAAICTELAKWNLHPPISLPARRNWVSQQLRSSVIGRIILTPLEITLCLLDQDSFDDRFLLRFADEAVAVSGPDLPVDSSSADIVTTLYEWLPARIGAAGWNADGSLVMTLGSNTEPTSVRLTASWPRGIDGWTLATPAGSLLAQFGNGGALALSEGVTLSLKEPASVSLFHPE